MTAARPRALSALTICVTALLALLAASATGAAAATTGSCPSTTSTPFTQWGDTDTYTLVPNGDFEVASFATKSGWRLTGGAQTVAGNERFYVHAKTDSKSLSLPAGATATTPQVCVNLCSPTIRLFATGGNSTTTLKVEVLVKFQNGSTGAYTLVQLPGGTTWAPTPATYFYANLLSLFSTSGTTNVQFRLCGPPSSVCLAKDRTKDGRMSLHPNAKLGLAGRQPPRRGATAQLTRSR
jgi:hypothetical protein